MHTLYIAGPFTAPTEALIEANIRAAESVQRELLRQTEQFAVINPHAMGRCFMFGPGSPAYWYDATLKLMTMCDAVLVVPHRAFSRGTENEIKTADAIGIPVFYEIGALLEWAKSQNE